MDAAAVIEMLGRDGRVLSTHKVAAWPLSIGRSPACDLVLDDGHLAAEHARLQVDAQGALLEMQPGLNGGWCGSQRLAPGDTARLGADGQFRLGMSTLRLRLASDPLAPELPMPVVAGRLAGLRLPALLLAWLGLLGFDQWSALVPGAPWVDYSVAVLAPLGMLLGWAALWALVTQLFQRHFPFSTHLWRALVGVVALHLASAWLPMAAYAFSAPMLMTVDVLVFQLGLVALLWWHASLVWPGARRGLAWGLSGMLVMGLTLMVAKRQELQHWFGPPYVSALPPPVFRVATPKPPEALIESLRPLEAELARLARKEGEGSDAPDAAAGD